MADETLYTLRQLASDLGLPESTARYYRDAYLDHIPSVGTGRRRRYPKEAAGVLRTIAKSYAAGRSRPEIVAGIRQRGGPESATVVDGHGNGARAMDEVSNLDLLAAILDGEREQRDALWQMAKEIVRLTEVLEGQDGVLVQIASQAGVAISPRVTPSLTAGAAAIVAEAAPAPPPPPVTPPPVTPPPLTPPPLTPPPVTPPPSSDLAKLQQELAAERALVDRLREAKLQLEHRTADAEAALAESKPRRSSVIRRILGGEGT